jgi:hypothetical protein
MKLYLITLLALVSTSAFATEYCSYVAVGKQGNNSPLTSGKFLRIVDQTLAEKGYVKVFDESEATYRVDFYRSVSTGYLNNPQMGSAQNPSYSAFGENSVSISLSRTLDAKNLYTVSETGGAGIIFGIASTPKSKILLKRILSNFPDCTQL